MPAKICLVLTTLDDAQKAAEFARSLVEQHLAACVQVLPGMRAHYRWQGGIEEAGECLVQIKTSPARVDALTQWLARHHPYDLAEIVRLDGEASDAYGAWVVDSVTDPKA